MNKIYLFLGFAFTLIAFSSCKKDYRCTCSENGDYYTHFEYNKVEKSAAEAFCAADEAIQKNEVSANVSCVVEEN